VIFSKLNELIKAPNTCSPEVRPRVIVLKPPSSPVLALKPRGLDHLLFLLRINVGLDEDLVEVEKLGFMLLVVLVERNREALVLEVEIGSKFFLG